MATIHKEIIPNNLLLAAATILFLATSCNKDYLKPKPLSFYTPENTYNTVGGLQGALAACSKNVRYDWYGDQAGIITQLIFSDEAVNGTTDKAGPAQDMNHQITPTSNLNSVNTNKIGAFWTSGYSGVKYANTVISYIDEPKWDTTNASQLAQRNSILGQAYFWRAFEYYDLCNEFGDVPWIGKLATKPKVNFYSVKREVILKKLQSDLKFAVKWVPYNLDKGKASKGACLQLLTKVDMELGDFDGAIRSASQIINSGVYHLMIQRFGVDMGDTGKNVVWDLHQTGNKDIPTNTEAILVMIDRLNTPGNVASGTVVMRNNVPLWWSKINTPDGKRGTIDKTGIEIDQATQYGRGIGTCRPTWYSAYSIWDNDPGDLRHAPGNWMTMKDLVYNNPSLKGTDPYYGKHLQLYNDQGKILCSDTIRCWYPWPYYKLYTPDPNNTGQPGGGNGDWYVYRLAGTYLLRAEAYIWKGDLIDAAADINIVRARAHAKPISSSDVNIGTVLDERARELYYETFRKVELTRMAYIFAETGKPAYNGKTYNLTSFSTDNFWYDRVMEKNNYYNKDVSTPFGIPYTMSPYHVLWPIPQASIDGNVEGHINQSQGYAGADSNIPPLDKLPVN